MRNSVFIIALFLFMAMISCKNSITRQNTQAPEIWEEGISMIAGVITDVKQEKDGQTIRLTNKKGTEYTAIVSIPNLRENAGQYREFKVGETISFKGNLNPDNLMIVRQVLEMR